MKVCFDVNVIIYLFADEGRGFDAAVAYDIAQIRKHETVVCASCLADISCILHRLGIRGDDLQRAMRAVFDLFDVADVDASDGRRALANGMPDYEDALIAECARRHGCDLIVTANVKDFAESPVPAVTPQDYSRIYKPAGYDFAEVSV